jgi:thiamine pyrophosphokinase
LEPRHTLIAAGGIEKNPSALWPHLGNFHHTIAADGGLRLLRQLNIDCEVLVGDFDTLESSEIAWAQSQGTRILRFPSDKAKSDLEIAIDQAIELGTTDLTLIGALGGELDHCLTNFISPLSLCLEKGVWGRLMTSHAQVYLTQNSVSLAAEGHRVSLLSLSARTENITLQGFKYPLERAALTRSQTLGLANEVTMKEARIDFTSGELFITLMHPQNTGDR